jgi:nucleotide-binding universal stress UspA family protein
LISIGIKACLSKGGTEMAAPFGQRAGAVKAGLPCTLQRAHCRVVRTYLTILDDKPEARVALRFAARRAAKTGGGIAILALVPRAEFVQWHGVQAAMEEEERLRVEAMVHAAAGSLIEETGLRPDIIVTQGEPVAVICELLEQRKEVAALVLGAAADGAPGPLIAHFAGAGAGKLPCPVMVVPGSLSDEALDRLS